MLICMQRGPGCVQPRQNERTGSSKQERRKAGSKIKVKKSWKYRETWIYKEEEDGSGKGREPKTEKIGHV